MPSRDPAREPPSVQGFCLGSSAEEGEVALCHVIASQDGFWLRAIVLRQQEPPGGSASYQTRRASSALRGSPGFYRTPSPQRSPLTTLTKSPVRVRFMLNSQRKPKEVMIPRLGLVNKKEANLQHHNFNSTCF